MKYRNRQAKIVGGKDHVGESGVIIQEPLANSRYVIVQLAGGLAVLIELEKLEIEEPALAS